MKTFWTRAGRKDQSYIKVYFFHANKNEVEKVDNITDELMTSMQSFIRTDLKSKKKHWQIMPSC